MHEAFLGGVVEGFYGQPWTQTQRIQLFEQMATWGLNTYFYAPKDDLKHRAIWRETYDEAELASLSELIDGCGEKQLRFIYGLSPGLDIRFSDADEIEAIKTRFAQLIGSGARHFALLFDDLPGEMSAADRNTFPSVAHAQCAVANVIHDWLRDQFSESRMLFCPTPYCDRMDRWQLGGSGYLDTLAASLAPEIDVLWTGSEIISSTISVASIERISERIGRNPVIWDNLHANDYDLRRLYCGPYSGRSAELLSHVRGILSNPNNEFFINHVPLQTLAQYIRGGADYDPRQAYLASMADWEQHFETVGLPIECVDLILLGDCYYLPCELGPEASTMLQLISRLFELPVESWGNAHREFLAFHARIQRIFEALTQLKHRELFYAWSRRAWELKEEMDLLQDYFARKQAGEVDGIGSETHLPGTYRGGLVAEIQRKLHMDQDGRFRWASPVRGAGTGSSSLGKAT